jgi:hypothetical protein
MLVRLGRYLRGSYPPAFYLPYALTWSLGMTALFALADPRITGWRPDGGTVRAALTFVVVLLLVRAVDDIRDLGYDRVHNPKRPLASGAVRMADLVVLITAGTVAGLLLNRGAVLVALLAALGYVLLMLIVDLIWQWPAGDNLVLSGLVGLPVQLLLNLYLYAGVLRQSGLGPSWHAVLPLLAALTGFTHLEYARKVTRAPRPGERSYVTLYGATGTAVLGLVSAGICVVLALVLTRSWLVLIPLAFPAYGAVRFWRVRTVRWPLPAAALFLLTAFLTFLIIGLLGEGTT